MTLEDSKPKVSGFYWLKCNAPWVPNDWIIVEVTEQGIWACGWECPLQADEFEWGLRVEHL